MYVVFCLSGEKSWNDNAEVDIVNLSFVSTPSPVDPVVPSSSQLNTILK